jgi:hypothetical protein
MWNRELVWCMRTTYYLEVYSSMARELCNKRHARKYGKTSMFCVFSYGFVRICIILAAEAQLEMLNHFYFSENMNRKKLVSTIEFSPKVGADVRNQIYLYGQKYKWLFESFCRCGCMSLLLPENCCETINWWSVVIADSFEAGISIGIVHFRLQSIETMEFRSFVSFQ